MSTESVTRHSWCRPRGLHKSRRSIQRADRIPQVLLHCGRFITSGAATSTGFLRCPKSRVGKIAHSTRCVIKDALLLLFAQHAEQVARLRIVVGIDVVLPVIRNTVAGYHTVLLFVRVGECGVHAVEERTEQATFRRGSQMVGCKSVCFALRETQSDGEQRCGTCECAACNTRDESYPTELSSDLRYALSSELVHGPSGCQVLPLASARCTLKSSPASSKSVAER